MLCPFSFVVIPAKAGIPKRLPSLEKFVEDSRPRLSSSLLGLAVAILIARVFLFATLQAFGNPTLPEPLRTEQTLNGTWRISKIVGSKSAVPLDRDSGFLAGYHRPAFDDSGWAKINIPSNWYTHAAGSFVAKGHATPFLSGWYRTTFKLRRPTDRPRVLLRFRGAGHTVDVFVNGRHAGRHEGRFTAFELDITPFVVFDADNVLAVRCEDDFGPWFGGPPTQHVYGPMFGIAVGQLDPVCTHGGIWKSVELIQAQACRVVRALITPHLDTDAIEVDALVRNDQKTPQPLTLTAEVWTADDRAAIGTERIGAFTFNPGDTPVNFHVKLQNPKRWSPQSPVLYHLILRLDNRARTVETFTDRFGFREFKIVGRDFYLNGQRCPLFMAKLEGYFDEAAFEWEKQHLLAPTLKGGFNIARTTGGPPPRVLLDHADEIGFMIYSEWAYNYLYKPNDIDEIPFIKNNLREMTEWMIEQYNHPSVVMWSLANEPSSDYSERPERIIRALYRGLKPLDKQQRPMTSSGGPAMDFVDPHNYTGGLGGRPWTFMPQSIDECLARLRNTPDADKPVVFGEVVGYGWGGSTINIPYDQHLSIDQYINLLDAVGPKGEVLPGGDSLPKDWLARVGLRAWFDYAPQAPHPIDLYGKRILEILRQRQDRIKAAAPITYASNLPRLKTVTQPVLVCLDNVALRRNIFSPDSLELKLFVVNDAPETLDNLTCSLTLGQTVLLQFPVTETVKSGASFISQHVVKIPDRLATGFYCLNLRLTRGTSVVSTNAYSLFVLNRRDPVPQYSHRRVALLRQADLNPAAAAKILDDLNIAYTPISTFEQAVGNDLLIVPPTLKKAPWNRLHPALPASVRQWLERGGRMLVLEPDATGPIAGFEPLRFADCENTFAEIAVREHPLFAGCSWQHFDSWCGDRGLVVKNLITPVNACTLAASAGSAEQPAGMAVAEVKVGRGLVLFSQFLATQRYNVDSAATLYLRNLFTYLLSETAGRSARSLPVIRRFDVDSARCVPIDFSAQANMGLRDEKSDDARGGLFDQGPLDFRDLPVGKVEFLGVPFHITDPAANHGKSCIVLYGGKLRFLPKSVKITLPPLLVSDLFFLETTYWVKRAEPVARYRVGYTDGSTETIHLIAGADSGDWYAPRDMANARVAWKTPDFRFGAYVRQWKNPHPQKAIHYLEAVSAENDPSLAILAVTGIRPAEPR